MKKGDGTGLLMQESGSPPSLSRKVREGRLVDECQSIKSWSLLPPSGLFAHHWEPLCFYDTLGTETADEIVWVAESLQDCLAIKPPQRVLSLWSANGLFAYR